MDAKRNHGLENNSLSNDEMLCRQHEEYLKQVSESGVPMWVADMYKDELAHSQPKPTNHDNDNQTDDTEPDPHMFI